MPRRPASAELLADLAAVLRRRRVRWYLFGAQAVVVHGRPRLTDDVDVTVDAVIAGRAKDLEDAGGIVEAHGNDLDVRRIKSVLGEIDAALADSDLVERFNRLLQSRWP